MSWLKNIRVEAGLTQDAIAQKVRISQASYSNIENGRRSPSLKTAKKIAETLSFNWTNFFEQEKAPKEGA